ncbi:MAG: hypothetical protein HYZ53_18315 [Planctomycetes bacterium]|nr:hypothetical protein [Planctomycetota bacterium]
MPFYADLHVHSKYSRATSKDSDLAGFATWAAKKGLAVVGTGDFTHSGWRKELRDGLVPDAPGLFRLRDDLGRAVARSAAATSASGRPPATPLGATPTRFLLTVELSTIYKRGDRTRRVHHLVCAPDFDTVDRLVERLARIGNLASDGRPILGLESRHLLELVLEAGKDAFLVPAHIWTPWFSALGSRSGFDSIEECYGDLAGHIFAVETGLSSDPPMNWRVSSLDKYRLVSNSDAHSPAKLGREACVFDVEPDYYRMRRALATGKGYGGTIEFFPEEGKYHLDGHRRCGVRLSPEETRRQGGLCPSCGKPATVGVLHRVESLADRPEGACSPTAAPFRSLVPLPELLGELLGVGADSVRVQTAFHALLARLGPELFLLEHAALEDLRRLGSPLLAEAVSRLRAGRVRRESGYDGEYGKIRVFEEKELARERRRGAAFVVRPAKSPGNPRNSP